MLQLKTPLGSRVLSLKRYVAPDAAKLRAKLRVELSAGRLRIMGPKTTFCLSNQELTASCTSACELPIESCKEIVWAATNTVAIVTKK